MPAASGSQDGNPGVTFPTHSLLCLSNSLIISFKSALSVCFWASEFLALSASTVEGDLSAKKSEQREGIAIWKVAPVSHMGQG